MELLFWTLAFLIIYTFVGYGFILYNLITLKRLFSKKRKKAEFTEKPTVSLIIPCYNEMAFLSQKIKNCKSLIYPNYKLEIIFVTDGSNDGSEKYLEGIQGIRVLHQSERKGKTAAMNRAVQNSKSDIVIFSDANALLNQYAILNIINKFKDKKVGCVAGEKRIVNSKNANAANAGEGIYWKYESTLKRWSSELNSVVGAAGELFAIRRTLFEVTPEDTILDDFIISLSVVEKGYKIAYTPDAYATETGSADTQEEMKRKVRICAGGIQAVIRTRKLLNPFRYPLFAFQYLSHRALRWIITPLALVIVFPLNGFLMHSSGEEIYILTMLFQVVFYTAALSGWFLQKKKLKIKAFFVPYYFIMMNFSALLGAKRYWTGTQSALWEKAKRLDVA